MSLYRVGIIRGGKKEGFHDSLASSVAIQNNLPPETSFKMLFLDRDGVLHEDGIPVSLPTLGNRFDLLWNTLHCDHAREATLQKALALHGIPFVGNMTHEAFLRPQMLGDATKNFGIKIPQAREIISVNSPRDTARLIFEKISYPLVVSRGTEERTAIHFPSLLEAVESLAPQAGASLSVREAPAGTPVHAVVVEGFRNQPHYVSFPIDAAGNLLVGDREAVQAIEASAPVIFRTLQLRHFAELAYLIHPQRGVIFVGVEQYPHLAESSRFAKALSHAGASMKEFVAHILHLAKNPKKR